MNTDQNTATIAGASEPYSQFGDVFAYADRHRWSALLEAGWKMTPWWGKLAYQAARYRDDDGTYRNGGTLTAFYRLPGQAGFRSRSRRVEMNGDDELRRELGERF